MDYNPGQIEAKWKQYWEANETYKVELDTTKPKFYILDMFPYPSGAGLHVGHPLGYIASDIYARFKRQKGFNVLHPMGYDAFGLPAEQYAIQTGVHPATSTDKNIAQYRSQLDNIGFNYDWSRSVKTSDPKYYKWTQWIFIQLFESYYDNKLDKANSISSLIAQFEKEGNKNTTASTSQEDIFTSEQWNAFSAIQRDEILMNYRLAYKKIGYVNWCEELGTVLANDEVKDGVSERGGYPVEKKPMRQWSLRITAYSERLLQGLEKVEWSESLKSMQRNWIGKSQGAQVFFDIQGHEEKIEIFTTRPDTIFGATFMVLAPEHDLVDQITILEYKQSVSEYINYVNSRSERERMSEVKEVTGVNTGAFAIHPITNIEIPIYLGEYVLKDYGTGAIMAVPSDDDRDKNFAEKYGIEIIPVVDKSEHPNADTHDKVGKMINSDFLNGLEVETAISTIINHIESINRGSGKINYRLRDANYSRQRYWGEPFPIYYDENGVTHTDNIEDLPITLPDLENFKPASGGQSPLARLESWVKPKKGITRETDTMPGFAGSSWYFLRYMDAMNDDDLVSKEAVEYWKGVDLYIGGTEHAVGHLMYSRFWHKFLYDLGKVPNDEPFKKLINQGMIQGVIEFLYMKKEKEGGISRFYSAEIAESMPSTEFAKIPILIDYVSNYGSPDSYLDIEGVKSFIKWRPEYKTASFNSKQGIYQNGMFSAKDGGNDMKFLTKSEVGKMSKRYFNVVNPDVVVEKFGADCFRMYEMFLGPIEQSKPWDTNGIDGVSKFLRKFWTLYVVDEEFIVNEEEPTKEEYKIIHTAIKKISEDIEKFSFNTAVSAFMVCVNELRKISCHKKKILQELVKLIAPFAPFLAEELWSRLGHTSSVHHAEYPEFNATYLVEDSKVYPVCINGKKRDEITISTGTSNSDIESAVLSMDSVIKWIDGKTIKKVIVVPNRMINIVV